MHEDGRVEDVDHTALGLPPDWAPPGFQPDPGNSVGYEAASPQPIPDDVAEAVVTPTGQPLPSQQAAQPTSTSTSSSGSVSASYTGPGLPMDFQPSGKLAQRAAREAKQQVEAFAPAVQAQKNAVTGMANAQAAGSDAQAAGYLDEAKLQRDQAEQRALEVEAINHKAQGYTDQIKEAINSVPTMDVKRIFKNQTNLESASMGIAAFMSGFSGNKQPMDIINRAVDQDIAEQQNAQEMAQKKIWNLKDLAKMDMDQAMWDLNQKDTSRLTALNALKLDVQAKVQGFQSEVFRKSGEKLIADLDKGMADTFQNIYTNTRDFLHRQWVDAQAAARASQALKIQQAEADTRRLAAESQAKLTRQANFLHRDTGVRATGPNALNGGWVAPNEKVREEAAKRFEGSNTQWTNIEDLKRLTTQGHFGLPGSEERTRAAAQATRMSIELMSQISGLGQKEDTSRMMKMFGGDPDQFFRVTDEETIKKVLQDGQDTLFKATKAYAKSLQYDPNDKVDWEPPPTPEYKDDVAPAFGDSIVELEAAVTGSDPEANVTSSVRQLIDEIKTYPGAINDPQARNKMDRAIELLSAMPLEQRQLVLNPGGVAEAQRAEHSGRKDLDRPLFAGEKVDPLEILINFRESPPTAVEEEKPVDPYVMGTSGLR